MLYEFLIANRGKILADTRKKTAGISEDRPTSPESERGLAQFYERLIRVLRHGDDDRPILPVGADSPPGSTASHGAELSRLGYTISQVVHGYGSLCQAITEEASRAGAEISAEDFSVLNQSLDKAIAEAVTAFSTHTSLESAEAVNRLGFLVHELRNSLAAATIAHAMLRKGVVGVGGSTNELLERNLRRMRDILDRSFSTIRLQGDKTLQLLPTPLIEVVEEVEATASAESVAKGLRLDVRVDPRISVEADRNYLVSALSNLVQNAIKYSKSGGTVTVRSIESETDVRLEVEDRCGGLPRGKAEELFQVYVQRSGNRKGLGLGLAISRQAVERIGGKLTVRDLPKKGCVFSITLPKRSPRRSGRRRAAAARPARGARALAAARARRYTGSRPIRAGS